ncbi:exported hypothetical protein [Xenorhabdus cabanillasii JM26]|uniref:Uncharacterized protein n=1 Tax=Xenorhabdus cabanillasii JM26 TaxID=1427517 RepID=W1IKM6_9GAMM|nr:exported hypothetical protein [Xenorhabdus cabanillasii JM26]
MVSLFSFVAFNVVFPLRFRLCSPASGLAFTAFRSDAQAGKGQAKRALPARPFSHYAGLLNILSACFSLNSLQIMLVGECGMLFYWFKDKFNQCDITFAVV